jgi:hypothetical protein
LERRELPLSLCGSGRAKVAITRAKVHVRQVQ